MKVAITYEIWDHGDVSMRIVGPHTVVHEHASEAEARESCRQMCVQNFPDTAHTNREYIINTKEVP